MSVPGNIISPGDFVNGGFVGLSNSATNFTILNTSELNVSNGLNVDNQINNTSAEQTFNLFSPNTFNYVMSNNYYSLNNTENAEEGGQNTSFILPTKSLITGANVILKNVVWTANFANGIYQPENKPVLLSVGYQISPAPPIDSSGNLTYDSTGYNIDDIDNTPGRIFYKTIANSAQIENGGGVGVFGAIGTALIGQAGTQGNINISPVWLRFSVDSVADTTGEQMATSAEIEIRLTTKIIEI